MAIILISGINLIQPGESATNQQGLGKPTASLHNWEPTSHRSRLIARSFF
jgi:hypothetical protein